MDVVAAIDARCSGKQHCNLHVEAQDTEIYKRSKMVEHYQKCSGEIKSYLELTYKCLKGMQEKVSKLRCCLRGVLTKGGGGEEKAIKKSDLCKK